jgi:hypothetical protein
MQTTIADEYKDRSNDDLIQLWSERNELTEAASLALQNELSTRGLSKEAADYRPPPPPIDHSAELAPPVQTYFNISVLWWWLRELLLVQRTKGGIPLEARVESTERTKTAGSGRSRTAARADLRYSYDFRGGHYSGRVVRDFAFNSDAADLLAFGHHPGETISILIDQEHPEYSYYPSGFGFVEPILVGGIGLLIGIFVVWFVFILLTEHVGTATAN